MTKKKAVKKPASKNRMSVEQIRVALGADEAIKLETDPSAGPLAVAAEAMSVRRRRAAKKDTAPDDKVMTAALEKAAKEGRSSRWPELPSLSSPPMPQEVDPPLFAFPASVVGTLLPLRDTIPQEFESGHTVWNDLMDHWFSREGLPADIEFHAKPGLCAEKCYRHVSACLRSFQPKHEHKMAGCAYLASCFFERVVIPSEKKEWKNP